jgi:microcystin-dependent protein
LVPISQYDTLFNVIGTTYGGNGTADFAVPNLNGRAPLGMGQVAGQPAYVLGQSAGTEQMTLVANQVGSHAHTLMGSVKTGTTAIPGPTTALAQSAFTLASLYGAAPTTTALAGASIGPAGGNQPHENRQPFLTVNYIIAAYGLFPPRG